MNGYDDLKIDEEEVSTPSCMASAAGKGPILQTFFDVINTPIKSNKILGAI